MKAADVEQLVKKYNFGKIKATIRPAHMEPSEKEKDELEILLYSQKPSKLSYGQKSEAVKELYDELGKAIGSNTATGNRSDLNCLTSLGFTAKAWRNVIKLLKNLKIPYGLDGDMIKEENKDVYFTKEARIKYLGFKY